MGRCTHTHHKKGQCRLAAHVGGPHSYATIRQVGAKALREAPALDAARHIVRERSGGMCEIADPKVCGIEGPHRGEHAHHVDPSDRDRGEHDPESMIFACAAGHRWIHDHPARAGALGLLRPEREAS